MSQKDMDQIPKYARLWESLDEEEQAMIVDVSLRRFKADAGSPIANANQLESNGPRRDEAPFVKTSYDRFAARAAARPKREPKSQ